MKTVSKKLLSVIIVTVMLASAIPFGTPAAAALRGDHTVEVIGGTAVFDSRNEAFEGLADDGDVLTVTANDVPGRTFEYWKTSEGDIITDSEFRMLVHANAYVAAHYEDTDEYEFGAWETVYESDDCTVPSVMMRENALGDADFKEIYVNGGNHSFGEWQADHAVPQAHVSTCRICGKEVFEEHDWYDLEVLVEPTHDTPGVVRRICSVCSYEFDFEVEPTDVHGWGDAVVTVPASGGTPGQRTRSCIWGDETQTGWYIDPDLKSLWKDHYINYYFSTRYGGNREERYFSFTKQDGSVVYVFAMQLTTSNARDNDQTFIFMYIDDNDPTTLEPVYLTKSGAMSSSMMQSFYWAPYDMARDFDSFVSVVWRPDGVNVPGITMSNNMSGRGSTLAWRYDDWAEEINGSFTDTSVAFADVPASLGYEIEAADVSFAKTNVYDNDSNLVASGGGFDGCTTYRKQVAPGQYDYVTVDPATGVTVRKWETVSDTNSYFREYKEVVSPAEYAPLDENEKKLVVNSDDVASLIRQFTMSRIGLASGFSLDVPDPYTAVRVQVDRSYYGSDYRVTGKNWDYNCYSTNVAGVFRTTNTASYPEEFGLEFEWNADNDNFHIFDNWEIYDFDLGEWVFLSSDPNMKINTLSFPLTGLTVIRPAWHESDEEYEVRVEGGWFCIDGEGDAHHNEETVPAGTRIYLVNETPDPGLSFTGFYDVDTGENYDVYSSFIVRGRVNAAAQYEQWRIYVNAETFAWEGGFIYFADDPEEGQMSAQSQDEVYYGDTVTLCAVSDTENGYTDGDWLGWYRIEYDDWGNEQWILLSTDMTATIEITQDGMIEAVWNNGNVPGDDSPVDFSEWIRAGVGGGFVSVRRYYGEEGDDGVTTHNAYSSLMIPAWSEIRLFDDPSDNLVLDGWDVTYVDADSGEEVTDHLETYEEDYYTYWLEGFEHYLGAAISFVGTGTESSGEINRGDANGDGVINVKDLTALKKFVAGTVPGEFAETNADVDGDGVVNVKDIRALKQLIAG